MKLLKNIIDDFDDLLSEQEGTSAVGGFVGRAGQSIDQVFAGPFHPEKNNLKKSLELQLKLYKRKRQFTDIVTPLAQEVFELIDHDYQYDVNQDLYDEEDFITKSETNMEYVGVLIDYDNNKPIYDKQLENEKNFINNSKTQNL